jgi:hypothetical protein
MAEREPVLVTPFWVRIATETSLSPGWLLVAFPAVLYPTYLALEALFGRGLAAALDFAGDWEARNLPVVATALGYLSMMGTYVARGTLRDLEALRPTLRGGQAAYYELRQQLSRFERRRLWVGALVGVAFHFVHWELLGRWTGFLVGEWSLRDPCVAAISFGFWILAGVGTMYLIDSSRVYSRIGEQQVEVDLLDLSPLLPLTRHGLRIVLLVVILVAVVMSTWNVGDTSTLRHPVIGTLPACIWAAVLSTAAFLLPVRGLRRQIRNCKEEELSRLRERIRRNRELVDGSGTESAEAGAKLPGLLAYKHEIESVREWPFDAPTLTRFFLYVAIPLGSWIGGALVERLLGAVFD